MALEYFLYDTTYGNTLVNRSNISFAPFLPYCQIYIDYFIPDIQPLFLYRESGGTIIHNQQSFINEYINSIMPPATSTDYIQFGTFSDYSGTTATLINTKLASSNFVTYTGTTLPATYETINCFKIYTGDTKITLNAKLSLSGGTLTGMLYGTSLNLSGDLTVLGTMHTVHEEQIYSTKDFIFLRSGNTQSLGVDMLSGIGVLNANGGGTTVLLGADKNAVIRVGWSGDTYVALAGREDNPHDGWYAKWDSGTTKFNTYDLDTIISAKLNTSIYQTYTGATASVINITITGATNGLTKFDDRNICLGGTLNNDVIIDLNTCKITFTNGSVVSCGATGQGFDSYNDYKLSGQTILRIPGRNFSFGNLALGFNALCSNTSGCYNTANGSNALLNNVCGCYNTANGSNALLNNTCGCGNVANGFDALYYSLTGNYNTALGSQTLFFNTCGCNNVAIGNSALFYNLSGNGNIANGINALFYNSSGSYNIANGFFALYHNLTGCNNIANGYQALCSNTSGCYNIANGYNALYCNKTGNTNVAIGYNAGYCETGSNKLYIANSNTVNPLIYGDFAAKCLKINGCLNVTGSTCSNKFIENGTCLSNTYLSKTAFSTYTGTTAPANYYNKTQINSYTGTTNTAIGNRLLTTTFSTYTGTTAPANYYNKTQIKSYTGATSTAIGLKANTDSPTFTTFAKSITSVVNDNSTCIATTAWYFGQCATASPLMDGIGTVGSSTLWAHQDHVHPRDTTKASLSGATFTGLLTANLGATINGAIINLNSNSNFVTNINDGTSTGTITLGGTGIQAINIGANTGVKTINIGNNNSPTNIIDIGGNLSTVCIGGVTNIIGIAGTANRNGIRNGASRIIESNKPTAPITALNANCTLTVTEVLEMGIIGFSASATRCLTLPTAQGATGLVQALPNAQVGDIVRFTVFNTCTCGVCICAGTGGTIVNPVPVTCVNSSRSVIIRITSITSGSETISVY